MLPPDQETWINNHSDLLIDSFRRLTEKSLLAGVDNCQQQAQLLFDLSFPVVSHDTQAVPVFNYANRSALELFEMDWQSFTALASHKSAEAVTQTERDRLLAEVSEKGFIDTYQGIRVSATGKRFRINNAVVWNLIDRNNNYQGQAAALFDWTIL